MTGVDVWFDAIGPRVAGRPGDRHSALSAVWVGTVLCVFPSSCTELAVVFGRAALGEPT